MAAMHPTHNRDQGRSGVKRIWIAVTGGTVLTFGVLLLVLPGPGLPITAAGLAILATEFPWARRALSRTKALLKQLPHRTRLTAWLRGKGTSPSAVSKTIPIASGNPNATRQGSETNPSLLPARS